MKQKLSILKSNFPKLLIPLIVLTLFFFIAYLIMGDRRMSWSAILLVYALIYCGVATWNRTLFLNNLIEDYESPVFNDTVPIILSQLAAFFISLILSFAIVGIVSVPLVGKLELGVDKWTTIIFLMAIIQSDYSTVQSIKNGRIG